MKVGFASISADNVNKIHTGDMVHDEALVNKLMAVCGCTALWC